MKKFLWAVPFLLTLAACDSRKNAATEYTGGLKEDADKARSAADKANAAIAEENKRTEEAQKATN